MMIGRGGGGGGYRMEEKEKTVSTPISLNH
jgi:hypothetical protein